MSYPRIAELVKKLADLTRQGKIKWEDTIDSGIFQYTMRSSTIKISQVLSRENDYASDIKIEIFNKNGDYIEDVTDEDIKDLLPKAYDTMLEMYENARRQAMGVEDILDDIFEELPKFDEDDIPF